MNILLVDLILGSHSVPFASNIKKALEAKEDVSSVHFVTIASDDRLGEYFDSSEDVYILDQSSYRNDPGYDASVVDSFRKLTGFIKQHQYDIIHFLQIDNIIIEGAVVLDKIECTPPVVAHINGAFFAGERWNRPSYVPKLCSGMLSSPLSGLVESVLLRQKSSRLAKDVALYRCIDREIFDNIFVHTDSAKRYIFELYGETTPVTIMPEPATVNQPEIDQRTARQNIGLSPDTTVLLFFGGLRERKGIRFLLNSLRTYDGPDFTLCVAGPEGNVSEEELERAKNQIAPSIFTDVRYIYDSEQYFIAADGVVCPYLEGFGEERTSHVFQEAIKLKRPVICPSFGSFQHRLRDYNLGILYKESDSKDLNKAIREFVSNPHKNNSLEEMESFSRKHSFDNLTSNLLDVYKSII